MNLLKRPDLLRYLLFCFKHIGRLDIIFLRAFITNKIYLQLFLYVFSVLSFLHNIEITHIHIETSHSRSEEHTSELQSRFDLVCRLLLEKKKKTSMITTQ